MEGERECAYALEREGEREREGVKWEREKEREASGWKDRQKEAEYMQAGMCAKQRRAALKNRAVKNSV